MRSPARWVLLLWLALGCRGSAHETPEAAAAPTSSTGWVADAGPEQRPGMVWVAGGPLVVGTPPDRVPRIADREMPGEQVMLRGFHIDVYPYPNEEGAIPLTNVTRDQAAALCEERGKRLCSELEWERACKGPSNRTFAFGDTYRAEACGTGTQPVLRPAGLRVACRSEFDVRDLHGGAFEWTSSPWGRGTAGDLAVTRGGNGREGELHARCAHAEPRKPESPSPVVGFRCCAGPRNDAEVVLVVKGGPRFQTRNPDRALGEELLRQLSSGDREEAGGGERFTVDKAWTWRPIGNELLLAVGGCAGLARRPRCGVLFGRPTPTGHRLVAWLSTGRYAPALHADQDPRFVWAFGGDDLGNFRQLVTWAWGRLELGPKERQVPKPPMRRAR